MSKSHNSNFDNIAREHSVLLNEYGRVQNRCSELVARQVDQIEALRRDMARKDAEVMRLRAELIARDTELAFAREDLATLKASIPGLPTRMSLVRRVESLTEHIQSLMRERLGWQWLGTPARTETLAPHPVIPADLRQKSVLCIGKDASGKSVAQMEVERAGGYFLHHDGMDSEDETALEASLVAADLVICQTGCVSHNAYWRIQDHCKRTGKQCVLVNQPRAMHFVRDAEDLLAVSEQARRAEAEMAGTLTPAK
ncbi:DUF2325 domain-containing protein [Herminiimonas sp. KBW02]|uniref:DUF2325 domain-containing protein n=1 Tax=Herminiimonas sp. KBW02 TaxID=2153363 RepID=UPI000F5B10B1|nr:DUF2325 domain-containing protein [Herminiimonas sp. KBW02]RQO37010.1 DUF2325 domain-containing protein [Herminiimonas sp. KBW02]